MTNFFLVVIKILECQFDFEMISEYLHRANFKNLTGHTWESLIAHQCATAYHLRDTALNDSSNNMANAIKNPSPHLNFD